MHSKGIPTTQQKSFLGTGVKNTGATRNKSQGTLQMTGVKTDLAIDGAGFFKLTDVDGQVSYTRNGALNVDIFGRLTDKDGNIVEVTYNDGVNPANTGLTNSNLVVDKNGYISTSDGQSIGRINLYDTAGSDALISKGDNKFVPANERVIMFQVSSDFFQGNLEMSNVDVGQEMTDMIMAQRAYQMASKGVTTADEMWAMLNNIR